MSIESRLKKIESEFKESDKSLCVCFPPTYAVEGNGGAFADVPVNFPNSVARMVGSDKCDLCSKPVSTIIRVVYNAEETGGKIPLQDYTPEEWQELKETGMLLPKV